jgi:uncharacterized membrane protein
MQSNKHENLKIRACKSTKRLLIWSLVWLMSIALMAFGPKLIWNFNAFATGLAIVINLIVGYKMILVNKQHLLTLDELQQRIQLNAMAFALGAGLVIGTIYETLEDIKVIAFQPEISHLIIVMAIVYVLSTIIGTRRYA